MSKVRRTGTKPETEIRKLLHAKGLRFRVDKPVFRDKRRRVDIAFGPTQVAVFVDGCFWHGCPDHMTWPKSNPEFWRTKIQSNIQRDRDTDQRLADMGWLSLRFWEHEDPKVVADSIERVVAARRTA